MIRTFIILFLLIISNDLSGINNTKKLKVGGEIDSAPFSYINEDGELEGFSVELLQNIMSDLNYDFEFSHYNKLNFKRDNIEFNNRILYECDLSLIAIPSLAHKRLHYYSIPYSQINYLIIGRADKPFSEVTEIVAISPIV